MASTALRSIAGLCLVAALAACSPQETESQRTGVQVSSVSVVDAALLPKTILGLAVKRESVANALKSQDRTYLDQVGLFSLRKGTLVMATLQVGRLVKDRDPDSLTYQRDLVYQLAGGARPAKTKVDGTTVWLARGTKQSLFVWFRDGYQLVLAVREDFETPRTLVRAAVEVDL